MFVDRKEASAPARVEQCGLKESASPDRYGFLDMMIFVATVKIAYLLVCSLE
jgi:hypothetical protein